MTKKFFLLVFAIIGAILLIVLIEFLYIRFNGKNVPTPEIPRQPETSGSGPKLTYVVIGDSTTVSQGGSYGRGYARVSAQHLSESYEVTMTNLGISGATARSVIDEQLEQAVALKPDLVLLGVGANDVTHFTKLSDVTESFQKIVNKLRAANSEVKIVVTRSPAVDSVSRFPIGARQLIKLRVNQLNSALQPLIDSNNLTIAPIAEETRQAFLDDPSLLAEDKFHPNDRGYGLWNPVIIAAIDKALK